jgi:CheY-like chemotaxis protein
MTQKLMDVQMPVMDGARSCTERIRAARASRGNPDHRNDGKKHRWSGR